ncbi:MAG: hypothetical protein ACTH6A_06660 [Brachybacterium tyrofermentans]|uniref:hypothetical protein n=1 Tax=Brachybacterium tyrofermentans TaxID=47848 RepID=UPI003F92262F
MKILGSICHVLAAIALVAAIWSPVGAWWQFLATALILFLAGAIILGQESQRAARYAHGGEIPQPNTATPFRSGEVLNGTGNPELDEKLNHLPNTRPSYGKKAQK